MLRLSGDSTRDLTSALSGRRVRPRELSAGTRSQELSVDSSETVRDALSVQDQDSERSSVEAWLEVKSSEDSQDKARDAPPGREATTDGLDADGARAGREPESFVDSTRAPSDAQSGKPERTRKPSAGLSRLELSEDSLETEDAALSGPRLAVDGSDVQEEDSQERSSEDGTDKVRDASPTREVNPDGPDAHGSESGEEPESSVASERVPTSALSGERVEQTRPYAGAPRPLS